MQTATEAIKEIKSILSGLWSLDSAAHKPWSTFCEHPGCDLERLVNKQYSQQTHPEAHWWVKGLEQAINDTKRAQSLKNYNFISPHLIARGQWESPGHLLVHEHTRAEVFVQTHSEIRCLVCNKSHCRTAIRPHIHRTALSALNIVSIVRSTGLPVPQSWE